MHKNQTSETFMIVVEIVPIWGIIQDEFIFWGQGEGSRQRKSKNPIQDKRNAQISDIRDVYDCGEDCAHLKNNPR